MPAPMDPSRRRPDRPRAWFVPRPLQRFLEQSVEMRPISLRFVDPELETDIQAAYYTVSLGVTYTRWFPPHWRGWMSLILLFNAGLWSTHRVFVPVAPAEWAYAGLMVVLMFCYILSRLPFSYSAIVGVVIIAYYNVVSYGIINDTVRELWLAHPRLVAVELLVSSREAVIVGTLQPR